MPWLQLHLTTSKDQAPLVELVFENMGALSVTMADAADEAIMELGPGETRLWQQTRITALFPAEKDPDDLRAELSQALNDDVCRNLKLEVLEDQAWERSWLDHFKPMRFGKRLWICPSGHAVDEDNAVVIDLDPGLAFGTGTHPTTALCLEWLDGARLEECNVIDFGCGSGILAIAALKLGGHHADGTDHDPQAILASRDNAEKNGVSGKLELFGPDRPIETPADIMLANILSGTLIELADTIAGLTKPGGDILLSGILKEQAKGVIDAYFPYSRLEVTQERDGWILLHGTRLE